MLSKSTFLLSSTRRIVYFRCRISTCSIQMSSQEPPQNEPEGTSVSINARRLALSCADSPIENIPEARKTGVLPTHRKTRLPFEKNPQAGSSMTPQQEAAKRFFESPNFAVAGATPDAHRFGYKRTSSSKTASNPEV